MSAQELADLTTDSEVREVIQAYQMLAALDAGKKFAERRCANLSQEAIYKAIVFLKESFHSDTAPTPT